MGFGGFISGLAGLSDSSAGTRQILGEAQKAASTKTFKKTTREVLPFLRELQAIGAIPGFQSAAATQIARRGLTGTGLGTALQTAAGGAGELFALQQALQEAGRLQGLQVGANTAFAQSDLSSGSNLLGRALGVQGLGGDALGGFAFSGGPSGGGSGGIPSFVPPQQINPFGAPGGLPFGANFDFPRR